MGMKHMILSSVIGLSLVAGFTTDSHGMMRGLSKQAPKGIRAISPLTICYTNCKFRVRKPERGPDPVWTEFFKRYNADPHLRDAIAKAVSRSNPWADHWLIKIDKDNGAHSHSNIPSHETLPEETP